MIDTCQQAVFLKYFWFSFTMRMAGGGVRGGMTHGATDDFGWHAVQDKVHVHDLHATVLHLMGLDHTRLTYRHAGRDYRLTDVHGNVVTKILADAGAVTSPASSTLPKA